MNEQELMVVFFLLGSWYRLSARRRQRSRCWYSSLAATILPYDRAGRLLPVPENRVSDWWDDDVMLMSELRFRDHFRMKRSVFERLVEDLQLPRSCNGVPSNKILGIALYRFATTHTLRDLSNPFSVSRSTAERCTRIVTNSIIQRLGHMIMWPRKEVEYRNCARTFLRFGSVYGVIGAVDGCLIDLKRKPGDPSWIDRYKHPSIQLLAVCDGTTRFLEVFVGCQGSFNDKRVLRLSRVPQLCQTLPQGYFIIGDGGFTLTPWCMIPFTDPQTGSNENRIRYNGWLSRSRVKIEHAFGMVKNRWRKLFLLDMSTTAAIRTIMACCILHNYCLSYNDSWAHDQNLPPVPAAPGPLPPSFLPPLRQAAQARFDAEAVRRELVKQLRNNLVVVN